MPVKTAVTKSVEGPWQLPVEWKWVHLENIREAESGAALNKSKRNSQGIYAVFGSSGYIGQHSLAKTKGPTIIIGRKGNLGSHFFSPNPCWPIDTTIYIDNFPKNINPKYIYFFLKSLNLQELGKNQSRPGLTLEDINNCLIPIPFPEDHTQSLAIQNQRAFYMEEALKNIEECQQLINQMRTDLNLLIYAELEQAFGNKRDGATVKNVPPEQVKKIKEIASYSRGKRLENNFNYFGGDTPWVEIHDLPKEYSKYVVHYTKTLSNEGVKMSRIFPEGSLAISIASTIGKMGILNFDAALPDSLVMITPNQSIANVGFLYWQFLYIRKYLEESATRAVNPNINLKTFDPIELWIPPLTEQWIIDTHLTSIQKDINKMVQQLEEDVLLLTEAEQSAREQAYGRIS